MFNKKSSTGYVPALKGIDRKTLVHGENTLMTEFRLKKGSTLPLHQHPHEQTAYLISGAMLVTAGGETFEANGGDSWCIPGGVEHGGEILKDSVALEVFSPVREDYLSGQERG